MKHKKLLTMLFLVMLFSMVLASSVFADDTSSVDDLYERMNKGSISEQLNKTGEGDETEILREIDLKVSNAVTTVRVVFTIFAVIFILWVGLIFLTAGGNPQKLYHAKVQIGLFFVCMFCVFAAEPIVRFALSWFI